MELPEHEGHARRHHEGVDHEADELVALRPVLVPAAVAAVAALERGVALGLGLRRRVEDADGVVRVGHDITRTIAEIRLKPMWAAMLGPSRPWR